MSPGAAAGEDPYFNFSPTGLINRSRTMSRGQILSGSAYNNTRTSKSFGINDALRKGYSPLSSAIVARVWSFPSLIDYMAMSGLYGGFNPGAIKPKPTPPPLPPQPTKNVKLIT